MQLYADVHGTTIYIFNGGITFLTEPYGVRFLLMENQGGAQEYAVKALILSWPKRRERRIEMFFIFIRLRVVVSLVMWTVMGRRVTCWSRKADEPGMHGSV
ncbi:hypothetical protein AtNW77_Chr3g0192301 [Arabidopsis thaliana]